MRKFKKAAAIILTATMVLGSTMTSLAAWQSDQIGWWWQNDDGTWPADSWQWLDGNGDGIAECYYFDSNGYMLEDTTTPDGYTVNADGAWTEDGVVQTHSIGEAAYTTTLTSEEIIEYLTDDPDNYTYFTIDSSKESSSSGSTNIKYLRNSTNNGWVIHPYYVEANLVYYCILAFDEEGYLLVNTTTSDGFYVNEYGMLEIDGVPVTHTNDCYFFGAYTTVYDIYGNLVTDKNSYPLSDINVNQYKNMISGYSGRIVPFGQLVYNHCTAPTFDGTVIREYGYTTCVEAKEYLLTLY